MLFDQEANPLQQSFNRLGWLKFTSLGGRTEAVRVGSSHRPHCLDLIIFSDVKLSNLTSKVKFKIK